MNDGENPFLKWVFWIIIGAIVYQFVPKRAKRWYVLLIIFSSVLSNRRQFEEITKFLQGKEPD